MRRPTADLMLLGTVSLWALNFTVSKYILDHGFHPLAYSAVRYACAALIFAGITLAWEGSLRVERSDLPLIAVTVALFAAGSHQLAHQSFDFPALVWIGFAFAVLGPLVTTNLLWFTAIDRVGPSRASLFANLQPFLAAIVALLLLHEKITMVQVAGGLAIGGGIVLASRRRPVPEPPAE